MNDERLEIARRFAACPKWVWLPGMHAVAERRDWPGMGIRVDESRDGWLFYGRASNSEASMRPVGMVPNLDDDLTRLGCLAVVRRAWGEPVMAATTDDAGDWLICSRQSDWWSGIRPTEEAALLAALEAA